MKIIIKSTMSTFNTFTTKNGKNIDFNFKDKEGIFCCFESKNSYTFGEAEHITSQISNCPFITEAKIEIDF